MAKRKLLSIITTTGMFVTSIVFAASPDAAENKDLKGEQPQIQTEGQSVPEQGVAIENEANANSQKAAKLREDARLKRVKAAECDRNGDTKQADKLRKKATDLEKKANSLEANIGSDKKLGYN